MDRYAVAALAHVHILLVPVGSISPITFTQWASEIRTLETLRLSDIPPGTKDEKARFMPSPKSKGHLHLSFPSHPPSFSQFPLELFRPSHFPLGVIGIASCSRSDSLSSILAEFNATVSNMFPKGSFLPLAKNCFVFEEEDGTTNLNLGDHLPGLVVIPSQMGNKKENIETLLADLCSNILGEFSTVMQTLETPFGNEYLNATLFPSLPSTSDMPRPLTDDGHNVLPSFNSQPELLSGSRRHSALLPHVQRTASTGPGMLTPTQRQSAMGVPRNRLSGIGATSSHGRLFKVLGDLFLLAGRIEDASVWYAEAITLFKAHLDNIWHASALEGLATISVLEGWASGPSASPVHTHALRDPWADITEKLEQAIGFYAKSPSMSDGDHHYDLLTYLYCSTTVRHASVLLAVWSGKGWGALACTIMLRPEHAPSLPHLSTPDYRLECERISSISGIPRSQIADILGQAHGPWLLHLGHRERISILEMIARIYALLGYHRKEVYILREVLGCIMDLLVCGREDLTQSAVHGFGTISISGEQGEVAMKGAERIDGNSSILALVRYICHIHGVDLETVHLMDTTSASDPVIEFQDPDNPLEDPYGWPELQVGIIREALAIAEALPDPPAVAQFSLSALKSLHAVLTSEDQYNIYATSARALTAAHRRGHKRVMDYWTGQPIVSIELLPLPSVRRLVENPISILSQQQSVVSHPLIRTDPFLYNPRKSMSSQGKTLVVEGESLEFVVTLRNPYVFDLDIQSLTLSTSGVPFDSKATSITIPSNSYHSITLQGKPLEAGMLVIKGCHVQAVGSASREFLLPLSSQEEDERKMRRRNAIACELGRSKYAGLESRSGPGGNKRSSMLASQSKAPAHRFLECKVISEQPFLRIRWSSLTHGAVMLYDGEKSVLRLTLENVSTLPVDFVRLTFDDSTMAPAQQALSEGELSVFDIYETEHDLIHRPVFSWNRENEKREILPGRKDAIVVTCTGKVGCTSGTIHLSYGQVNQRQQTLQQPAEVFHTRQLSYPVIVTVYNMLECHGMDIVPFSPDGSQDSESLDCGRHPTGSRKLALRDAEDVGWCLFTVDVRNTYGLPFEVVFERHQEDTPHASTTCLVAPGCTTRMVLPIKKFLLTEEACNQPIPTLSDRQFVVDKSAMTSLELNSQRELFWYREELFKCVHGRWREAGGARFGELTLRKQRLTYPMLDTLRIETTRIQLSLFRRSGEDRESWVDIPKRHSNFFPRPYEFVYLRVQVKNMSQRSLVLTVDVSAEPSDHVIHEGILSEVPVGRIDAGGSRNVEIPLCFVACGEFQLAIDVRLMGARPDDGKVGSGLLKVVVEDADA
ncbi:TRAPP II complex [Amylostereum chailletii]|nr:TRAPP II complex [Amylostereum chailletii]